MKLQTFFDHFERLTDAPNAVARLRELVLQLAVQGKLVEQDERDEPAARLLERIKAERKRLIREKKIKEAKPLPPVSDDEKPFMLPRGWTWTRFGNITINRDGERMPVEKSIREQRQGKYDYYGASGVIDGFDSYIFDKPLLLIGEDGANLINRSTPIAFIAYGKYWVNNHAHVIDSISLDCLKYLELYINATDLRPYITGTAQPKMNQAKMNLIPIAVPPHEEQKRIVAKVDGLMRLCDELERVQVERREARQCLNSTALDQLIIASDAAEFQARWQIVSDHFPTLTAMPAQIGKLRQTILQLAVQGKLTRQDPPDGLAADGRVSDYVKILNGYAFKSEWFVKDGVRLLRNANVGHGSLRWDDVASIPADQAEEFSRFALTEGDIVISLDRPIISTGVKVARVSSEDLPSLLLQRVGKVEFKTDSLDPDFFFMWLQSPLFINAIDPGRSNGVPHISSKSIESLPLIFPSLPEQKRIVAAVNLLIALCDKLEVGLCRAEEDGERLLQAAVRSLLASASENQVEVAALEM